MKGFKWSLFLCVIWLSVLSAAVTVSAKSPDGAVIRQTGAKDNTVSISWQERKNAAYYKIYYKYVSQSHYRYVKDVEASKDGLKTSVRSLKPGKIYHIQVVPYDRDGKRAGAVYQTECRTLPGKISLRSQKSYATSRAMKFFWNAVESVTGYGLQVTDLDGRLVGQQRVRGRASTVFNGLAAGRFYRLRIRGYVRINGKTVYGPASYTYVAQQPRVRFKWASRSVVKVSWAAVTGAADYSVYVTDDPSRGFQRVTTVPHVSAVIPGLNRDWKYYVYVVANMRKGERVYASPRTNHYTFRLQME